MRVSPTSDAGTWGPKSPSLLRALVDAFPLGTIVDGSEEITAHRHVEFAETGGPLGTVAFSWPLPRKRLPMRLRILVSGPAAEVSSLQEIRPSVRDSVPNYHFLRLVLLSSPKAELDHANDTEVGHLSSAPRQGAPEQRFRMPIANFELTAHLETDAHKQRAIIAGLRKRAQFQDEALADLLDGFDGRAETLIRQLESFRHSGRRCASSASLCWARGH